MNKSAITELTIDDYIREQKKKGIRKINWNKEQWAILKEFAAAVSMEDLGYAPFKIRQGGMFMGVKHFKETAEDGK